MISAAKESGKRLFVALPARYDPANRMASDVIDSEEINYPYLTIASLVENEYDRLNDWHDWHGTWDVGGGGVLMQHGCEMVDLLRYFLGPVDAVSAVCTRFSIEALNKAEDSCLLDLDFVEEVTAQLAITGAARYSPWPEDYTGRALRVEIYGIDGAIRITNSDPRLVVSSKNGYRIIPTEPADPLAMDRDFIECILQEREPLVTLDDARHALQAVLAGYKASLMKRRVETLEQL